MRRTFLAVVFMAICCAVAFADEAGVVIQNEEASTFYYAVDPADLAQLSAGSPLAATRVAEFFAQQSPEPQFTALASGQIASLQGLSNGPHLLVGFFAFEDQDAFPVRVITLQVDNSIGERFYAIYGSPALVYATRGVGRLAAFAGTAAPSQGETPPAAATAGPAAETAPAAGEQSAGAQNTPGATPPEAPAQAAQAGSPPTQAAPSAAQAAQPAAEAASPLTQAGPGPLVSFSTGYNPVVFTREAQNSFSVQPIAASRSWSLPATHISTLDARIDQGALKLSLSIGDDFSPDVSYFVYAFKKRTPGSSAIFTLEIRPRALQNRGACLLWLPQAGATNAAGASATPSILGTLAVEDSTATLVVDPKTAPPSFLPLLTSATSFDITSCRFDATTGVYEEFYFTTVAMADIPVTR